jgi:signal transduction histidine kinase
MGKQGVLLAVSDDEACHPMTMGLSLGNKGYQVTAARGDAAVGLLREKEFDVVITDLFAVLEKAKQLSPATMGILVLATSSKSIPTADAIRSSADDYLFKPFDSAELEMRIAHYIEKVKLHRRNPQFERCEAGSDEKILDMVRMMAHDVRGSLLSVSATLKLLTRGHYGKMDEEAGNRIKELFAKISSLIGMTEEYLARSFSVNGDPEAREDTLDLMKHILIPVLKELSSELKGHQLLIDHRLHTISKQPISIRISRVWLKMVFRNLLKNAIKFGDPRGMIAVGFKDHGSFYQFNVYNSGNPIPEPFRKKLFTNFWEDGNHDNEREGVHGTGLGLYLIKKVIQKLGGEIWYEAKDNGSNFSFTLPSSPASPVGLSLPIGTPLQMTRVNP